MSKNNTIKEQKPIKKALYIRLIRTDKIVKRGKNMPLLCDDFDSDTYVPFTTNNNIIRLTEVTKVSDNNFLKNVSEESKSNTKNKKIKTHRIRRYRDEPERMIKKTAAQLKSWEFQIKSFKKRNQLFRTMRKIHGKEHKICIMLSKNHTPVFKVIPGNNYRKYYTYKVFHSNMKGIPTVMN